ncbi:MAG: hypothetical protein IJ087_11245 [Eggerthellaceae bacterium]|nr:hypothetical protein [Eggerthellaceae bacterium]
MARVADAVQSGDKRKALLALRDDAAATIEATESARDKAALINGILKIMDRLDALPDPDAGKNPVQAARERARNRGNPS